MCVCHGLRAEDKEERARLFAAARASPAAEARGSWAAEAFDAGRSFTERLVAFAFAQVVLRSGAYCAIFRLKDTRRGSPPLRICSGLLVATRRQCVTPLCAPSRGWPGTPAQTLWRQVDLARIGLGAVGLAAFG